MPTFNIMIYGNELHVRDLATLQNCNPSPLALLTVSPLRRVTWVQYNELEPLKQNIVTVAR
jgi:hypothetical protein